MALCSNRPDSFSRTCLTDIVWEPLPTWLLLLALALLVLKPPPTTARRELARVNKWLAYLGLALIVASFAMQVLEIARLGAADLGVGLLPFVLVGLLLSAPMMVIRCGLIWPDKTPLRHRLAMCDLHLLSFAGLPDLDALHSILLGFWFLSWVATAIAVGESSTLPGSGPSKYPNSDRVTDEAVSFAVYVVLFFLEAWSLWRDQKAPRNSVEMTAK